MVALASCVVNCGGSEPSSPSSGSAGGTPGSASSGGTGQAVGGASSTGGLGGAIAEPAAHALELGASHSCARLGDGTVKCWGRNDYGGLGDGTVEDRMTPVAVGGLP